MHIGSGGGILPKKEENLPVMLKKDRLKRIEKLNELLEQAGEGLLKSQVELKHAPWHVTWERQDLLIERQEKIIELLEQILNELKKK